jgi:peptidoglycan/xylan/chitin deacetylase (PgdA/CDA1 family)
LKKIGTYTIKYEVSDNFGNKTIKERILTIKEKPKPKPPLKQEIEEKPTDQNTETTPPPVLTNPENSEKIIYLTFDDGPCSYTKDLLDILDKYNVKVTFFVVNKPKYNYLIKEAYNRGHAIGIHSLTHEYSQIYKSKEAYYKDLYAMRDIIKEQTGVEVDILRFPGGGSNKVSAKYCKGIMSELTKDIISKGFQYFDWNVSSGDAGKTTSASGVYKNVINGIKGKNIAVVLQHDIKKFSVDAVEDIIKWGLENGYKFLPLDKNSFPAHHSVNN